MPRAKQLSLNLDDPTAPERSALNELFSQSVRYRNSVAYYSLIKFIARFSRYSPFNCMLLHIQNPEVTYIATLNSGSSGFDEPLSRMRAHF